MVFQSTVVASYKLIQKSISNLLFYTKNSEKRQLLVLVVCVYALV